MAAIGVSGCGGGMPSGIVVQIGARSISKATLDHWTAIEAATDYETNPSGPLPTGVVPDPPRYSACIARLRETTPKVRAGTPRPTRTSLEKECRQKYRKLQQHVLNVLITFQWLLGESEKQGVNITDSEVNRQYERFSHERFPKTGELKRYLTITGESLADERLRMKMDLLGTRLNEKMERKVKDEGAGVQQQLLAVVRWNKEFVARWLARTNCRVEYVVSNCRQYRGALKPETRL
jgi:foldase protein PrsA